MEKFIHSIAMERVSKNLCESSWKKELSAPVWDPAGRGLVYAQRVGNWETHVFKIMLADGQWELLTDIGFWNYPADWFDPAYALPVSPQPQLLTTIWGDVKKN